MFILKKGDERKSERESIVLVKWLTSPSPCWFFPPEVFKIFAILSRLRNRKPKKKKGGVFNTN